MRARPLPLLAGLAATLALAVAAGTAGASRSFSVVGGGRAIATRANSLSFTGDNGLRLIAAVTFHGSIHALVAKAADSPMGVFTRILMRECRTNIGVECTFIGLGPWPMRLLGFSGTLPRITLIDLAIDWRYRIELARGRPNCLFTGTQPFRASGRAGAAEFTMERIEAFEGIAALFRAEGEELFFRCPRTLTVVGLPGLVPSVTVRLH